jgi:arabinofuranan 3-O-arabinosyltransferase
VTLGPGEHRITVAPTAEWYVDSVALVPEREQVSAPASVAIRNDGSQRVLSVGPSTGERVVSLAENYNAGLTATQDGVHLQPVRLDGWRQGFVLPAGGSGEVAVTYAPDGTYRVVLLAGLLCALLLCGLVLLPSRRPAPAPLTGRSAAILVAATAVGCVALTTGAIGVMLALVVFAVVRRSRHIPWVVLLACLTGVITETVVPWPARASSGDVVDLLLTLPIAVAVGAAVAATLPAAFAADSDGSAPDTAVPAGTS